MLIATVACTFFVLLLLGFPISMAMGCGSLIGILVSDDTTFRTMAVKVFTSGDSFALMAMPFFMLGGQIMEATGITESLVKFARTLVGWMRGGLAHTCTVAGVFMAGISGSAGADSAALGALLLPALRKEGYEDGQSVAIIASAGSLGPIIPPSISMIIYCSITNVSVGAMFMAGYLPGIFLAICFIIIATIYAKRRGIAKTKFMGFRAIGRGFIDAIWALLMPVIIIGGILTGIFTATEAGAVSAIYGIVYGFATRRLTFKKLFDCAYHAVLNSAGPMSIILFASTLGYLLTAGGLSRMLADVFLNLAGGGHVPFCLFIILCVTIAGMFVDGATTMLILVPILFPVSQELGMGVIHFSMVYMMSSSNGGITPPVGAQLFIVSAIGKIPLKKCIKPIIPYVSAFVLLPITITFFPEFVEIIPKLAGYTV